VLGHESLRDKVAEDGASFVGLRNALQYDSTDEIPPDEELAHTLEKVFLAKEFAVDVSQVVDRVRPDLLLVDAGLVYGMVAAHRSGIPTVAMWHTLYSLVTGGPFAELFNGRLSEINEFGANMGLAAFPSHRKLLESASLMLVFSYRPFDPVKELDNHVLHVGPLRSPAHSASRWERRYPDRPLVLVGLSTTYQDQTRLLQMLCDALATLQVEAVITTGPAISPSSLDAPRNAAVLEYVSHDAVLPVADLLVTHAGHGTVMAGIRHGVPMLCVPMGRDQPAVADRVAELGLGNSLEPDASEADIRNAIELSLADDDLKRSSSRFSKTIADHPGFDLAISTIESLI
jgi:UDP-N-acetylglucosamine:LPS N-acetylglucosamine transferase